MFTDTSNNILLIIGITLSVSLGPDEHLQVLLSSCGVVQNRSSSRLLSKNLKIKIYRTVILPVVLYGCETWSLTLQEER